MFFSTWLADNLSRPSLQSGSRKFVLDVVGGSPRGERGWPKMVIESTGGCCGGRGDGAEARQECREARALN